MTDIKATMELLEKNGIDYRLTPLYDEKDRCGSAIWLDVGHIEFDLLGTIKNIVTY